MIDRRAQRDSSISIFRIIAVACAICVLVYFIFALVTGIEPIATVIACALLFIAVLLIITHLLRKEPAHAADPAKPAVPKVYVPSGDIVLGGRNEDDDEENL